jgi:hypothetical protein
VDLFPLLLLQLPRLTRFDEQDLVVVATMEETAQQTAVEGIVQIIDKEGRSKVGRGHTALAEGKASSAVAADLGNHSHRMWGVVVADCSASCFSFHYLSLSL